MLNKPMNYMQTQEYIARKVQEADEFLVGEKDERDYSIQG